MNTRLGRQYNALTPIERIRAIIAAHQRGDAREMERLHTSAPVGRRRERDHDKLNRALDRLESDYVVHLLTLAGAFWRIQAQINQVADTAADHLVEAAHRVARQIVHEETGWAAFMGGRLKLPSDPPVNPAHPGAEFLTSTLALARLITEIEGMPGGAAPEPHTIARQWHNRFDDLMI